MFLLKRIAIHLLFKSQSLEMFVHFRALTRLALRIPSIWLLYVPKHIKEEKDYAALPVACGPCCPLENPTSSLIYPT